LCERINPPDSSFCNACGTPLQLVPCARCGAVNDPTATSCYQCGVALPENRLGELARSSSVTEVWEGAGSEARTAEGGMQPAQPSLGVDGLDRDARLFAALQQLQRVLAYSDSGAAPGRADGNRLGSQAAKIDVLTALGPLGDALRSYRASAIAGSPSIRVGPRIVPRLRLAVIVGTVVLGVLAAAGYYAYRRPPVLDVPQVPAASGVAKGGVSQAASGVIAVTPPPPVAAEAQPIAPAPEGSAAATGSGTALPGDARSSSGPTSSVRRSAEAGPGILELQPPRVGPCTDSIAALGLCVPEAIQRSE
jgi:hypothetical protein